MPTAAAIGAACRKTIVVPFRSRSVYLQGSERVADKGAQQEPQSFYNISSAILSPATVARHKHAVVTNESNWVAPFPIHVQPDASVGLPIEPTAKDTGDVARNRADPQLRRKTRAHGPCIATNERGLLAFLLRSWQQRSSSARTLGCLTESSVTNSTWCSTCLCSKRPVRHSTEPIGLQSRAP